MESDAVKDKPRSVPKGNNSSEEIAGMHRDMEVRMNLSTFIFQPRRTMMIMFSRDVPGVTFAKMLGLQIASLFTVVACIQYWWFGQLYLKSSLLLLGFLAGASLIPTITLKRGRYKNTILFRSMLLIFPAVIASVIIVIFRLGFIAYIDKYLYRSPLLVALFLGFSLGTVVMNTWCRKVTLEGRKTLKKTIVNAMLTFVDLLLIAGVILLLLNFEGLLSWIS